MTTFEDVLEATRVQPGSAQADAMRELIDRLIEMGSSADDAYRAVATMVKASNPLVKIYDRTIARCVVLTDPGWQWAIKTGWIKLRWLR